MEKIHWNNIAWRGCNGQSWTKLLIKPIEILGDMHSINLSRFLPLPHPMLQLFAPHFKLIIQQHCLVGGGFEVEYRNQTSV